MDAPVKGNVYSSKVNTSDIKYLGPIVLSFQRPEAAFCLLKSILWNSTQSYKVLSKLLHKLIRFFDVRLKTLWILGYPQRTLLRV